MRLGWQVDTGAGGVPWGGELRAQNLISFTDHTAAPGQSAFDPCLHSELQGRPEITNHCQELGRGREGSSPTDFRACMALLPP